MALVFISLFLIWHVSQHPSANTPRSNKKISIVAHRGASGSAPENTLAAFRKAIDLGADVLELDVHQTHDSQLVVIHDATVDRTTNGKGPVKNFTAKEIQKLDAGSWFSPAYKGEKVPLLSEVLDTTPDTIPLLIELKEGSEKCPGIEARTVQLIREKEAQHRVIPKSFEDDVLERFRLLAPDIPRLKIIVMQIPFLHITIQHGLAFGTILNDSVQYLQHHWFGLTEGFIDEAHRRGYKVFAWDVHDDGRMREMIEMGIDGIETDYPDKLRSIVRGK